MSTIMVIFQLVALFKYLFDDYKISQGGPENTNELRKALKNSNDIAFLLGIGYADNTRHQYKSWIEIPTLDEIVKWK